MWVWIVIGIMGFLVVAVLITLVARLLGVGRGYSLQRGGRPQKRRDYNSSYHLQRGGHQKMQHLNLRTGRLQRGSRPKKRTIDLD